MSRQHTRIKWLVRIWLGVIVFFCIGTYHVGAQQLPPPPRPKPTSLPDPNERPAPVRSVPSTSNTVPRILVVLEATPNIWVQRGGTLTYKVRIKNIGGETAANAPVYMPYNPAQLTIVSNELDTGTVVNDTGAHYVSIIAYHVKPGEERAVTLHAQVADDVPDGTVLPAYLHYHQRGKDLTTNSTDAEILEPLSGNANATIAPASYGNDGMIHTSNVVPVLVGAVNSTSPLVWMQVVPEYGTSGTIYHFFSDRFVPGECVAIWLNTPSGVVQGLDDMYKVNKEGHVQISIESNKYTPGVYQLVALGKSSNLQAAATFVIEP